MALSTRVSALAVLLSLCAGCASTAEERAGENAKSGAALTSERDPNAVSDAPTSDGTTRTESSPTNDAPTDLGIAPVFDTWDLLPNGTLELPCDFPGRGGIEKYECSTEQAGDVNVALDLASYTVWRVLQVLNKVAAAGDTEARMKLWQMYFEGTYVDDGWSLQNWFGSYSDDRFGAIYYAYTQAWAMYLGPGFKEKRISCACTANAMSAHAANPWGIEVCPKFFYKDPNDSVEDTKWRIANRARVLVHEFMHDVKGEKGNIQDIHVKCEIDPGDDGAEKCYSPAESLMLAQHYPDIANENPQNYALYSRELGMAYHQGKCTDQRLCSPRNTRAQNCQPQVQHEPEYPECTGAPGEVNCPCADVDIGPAEDAAKDGGYPDGEGSFLANKKPGGQYCTGQDVVCGKTTFWGRDFPICKQCTKEHPEVGCPCTSQEQCGDQLECWGSHDMGFDPVGTGTCLPKEQAKLEQLNWFCLDNCASISSDGENGAACVYRQIANLEFSHGTCVNLATSCGMDLPGQCEMSGKICRVDNNNNDVCVAECKTKADCALHGFPDTYECDAEGKEGVENGHCVQAGCANETGGFCGLFR